MSDKGTGIAYWRARLGAVRLPVLSDAPACAALLQPDVSLQSVAAAFQADLSLGLDAVVMAARLPRISGNVHGLHHAVGILGVTRAQALVRERMSATLDPSSAAHRAFAQAIEVSRFAAALVRTWEGERGSGGDTEYLEWVTLLLGMARWKLALAAPDEHLKIEQRVRRGERRAAVELAVLGCSMDALNAALLVEAGFPANTILLETPDLDSRLLSRGARHAWSGCIAPGLPTEIARRLRQRNVTCLLAHLLAWSAHDDWHGRRTRLLFQAVSAQRNRPVHSVVADSRRAAVQVSRGSAFAGIVFLPAQQLFWASPARRSVAAGASEGTAQNKAAGQKRWSPAPAAPAVHGPTPQPDAARVERFFQNCLHGRHEDLREFMLETCGTLEAGLKLNRCLLFLKSAQQPRLGCYFAYGFDGSVQARELSLPADGDNLVARLFSRAGAAVWVDPARHQAGRKQLPPELQAHALPSGFLLGGIALDGRPVGVLWADSGCPQKAPDAGHYAQFRHMTHHFGKEFTRLAYSRKR